MKRSMTKIGSVAILTTVLFTACNKAPEIAEDYDVHAIELGAFGFLPFKEHLAFYSEEEIQKEFIPMKEEAKESMNDNEWLSGFHAPKHPDDENVVFLSTEIMDATGATKNDNTNRILTYNMKTGEVKEIYKDEEEGKVLRTAGIEGNRLIVMSDTVDNSPGPCFSFWADLPKLKYLDVTKPEEGLKDYEVPEYKKEEAKTAQEKCMKETFGETN